MEKILYILRGVPGSGKTTLAEIITSWGKVFEADKFPGIYDEQGVYQKHLIQQSHDWCFAQVREAMESGMTPLVLANTSAEQRFYERYMDLASEYNYIVKILVVEATLFPNGESSSSIHNVSVGIVLRQRITFQPYVQRSVFAQTTPTTERLESNLPTLHLFDRDRTLVYGFRDGAPQGQLRLLPDVEQKLRQLHEAGDVLAVVSNQAGLVGEKYKTEEELLDEACQLQKLLPWLKIHTYCPDYDGTECLIFAPTLNMFIKRKASENQCYRKPEPGMAELILEFAGQLPGSPLVYKNIVVYGDDLCDKLMARAINAQFISTLEWLF